LNVIAPSAPAVFVRLAMYNEYPLAPVTLTVALPRPVPPVPLSWMTPSEPAPPLLSTKNVVVMVLLPAKLFGSAMVPPHIDRELDRRRSHPGGGRNHARTRGQDVGDLKKPCRSRR